MPAREGGPVSRGTRDAIANDVDLQKLLDLFLRGGKRVHDVILNRRVGDLLSAWVELLLVGAELGAHDDAELNVPGDDEVQKLPSASRGVVWVAALCTTM